MTDGFFTRPSLARVGLGRIAPSAHIDSLPGPPGRAAPRRSAARASSTTGSTPQFGGRAPVPRSAAGLRRQYRPRTRTSGRSDRGCATRVRRCRSARSTLTLVESTCPPTSSPGVITGPCGRRARTSAYRCGEPGPPSCTTGPATSASLIQGSAGFVPTHCGKAPRRGRHLRLGQLGYSAAASTSSTTGPRPSRAVGAHRWSGSTGTTSSAAVETVARTCPTPAMTSTTRCGCSELDPRADGSAAHLTDGLAARRPLAVTFVSAPHWHCC